MRLDTFNAELLTIGGRAITGQPRLRCVSALTETHFACGGTKIKYVAHSRTEERWLWGLKDMDTGVITAKSEQDVIDNHDPRKFGVRKLLAREVTWSGHPNYVVEYYRSPLQMKDSPLNWERNRFNWWYNPETERREWTDMLGAFPHEGRYDLLLIVKEDDGKTVWGKPRELGDDILVEVRKAMRAHEAFKKVNTDEELIRHMVEAQAAREDKVYAEIADQAESDFGADWRKMVRDNPEALINEIARVNALEEQKT